MTADERVMETFVRSLLADVQAFEYMLENDWFESDIARIGAEQEMCLVHNKTLKPATINMQILEELGEQNYCVTELAKFNLEINLSPQEFTGQCLSLLEKENLGYLDKIQQVLNGHDASIVLCGILFAMAVLGCIALQCCSSGGSSCCGSNLFWNGIF